MYDSRHYVPILKWKRAEQGALKALTTEQRKYITPLVQFVMPKQKAAESLEELVERFKELAQQIAKDLLEVWGSAPLFIDTSLLFTTPLKTSMLRAIGSEGHKLGGTLIPVIHIKDDQGIQDTAITLAKETNSGVCLRIIVADFVDINALNDTLGRFLTSSGLSEKDVDLLVDMKETGTSGGKCTKYLELSQQLTDLPKWRTFTFASGAFPENLSECKLDEENLIPRVDWKSWREFTEKGVTKRKPAFADYTIQHPIYKESSQFFHPTSSIKYTLEENWLIMKGQRQKFELYLASAATLVKDKRFYGATFSDGDSFIAGKAAHFDAYMKAKNEGKDIKGTGSTET